MGFDEPQEADSMVKNLALASNIGSVFGLGWHADSQSLFAAAFMKAWTGFGPGGTGAIYRVDATNPANSLTTLYADLNQLFPASPPTAGDDPYLTGTFSAANTGYVQIADGSTATDGSFVSSGDSIRDNQSGQISGAVWSTSLGDLDVSKDGTSLFVTNMANNKLYVLPLNSSPLTIADAASIGSYDIPFETNCTSRHSVFGLGEYKNNLYVVSYCRVSSFNFNQTSVFRFDLTTKQFDTLPVISYLWQFNDGDFYFVSDIAISDIVFDPQGNMTLALRPQRTDWSSDYFYGLVRRACLLDESTYS